MNSISIIGIGFKNHPVVNIKNNVNNNVLQSNSETRLNSELEIKSMLGKSNVNFRSKFRGLNTNDTEFVLELIALLGLSFDYLDKLIKVVSDYLARNNMKTMEDMYGDEYSYDRLHLADELSHAAGLYDDDDTEAIIDRAIDERCNAVRETPIYDTFLSIPEDIKYIETIKQAFDFDCADKETFAVVLLDTMDDINASSLDELRKLSSDAELELAGRLSRVFPALSDIDVSLIIDELQRRINEGSQYVPRLTALDRDPDTRNIEYDVFRNIMKIFKNIPQEWKLELLLAMKKDASLNDMDNILELFKDSDNMENCPNTSSILNTKVFSAYKNDITLHFFVKAQDIERAFEEVRVEQEFRQNNYLMSCECACNIDSVLNLPYKQFKKLQKELDKHELFFMFNDDDIMALTQDIIAKLNLPPDKSQEIFEAIKNTDIENYSPIKFIQLLIEKSGDYTNNLR